MIRLVEALNFRCLRYVRQPLRDFHVMIGPNASGKTTFMEVVSLLSRILRHGLEDAVFAEGVLNFTDLLFKNGGDRFELAVELEIPEDRRARLPDPTRFDTIRFEIAIGYDPGAKAVHILDEQVILLKTPTQSPRRRSLFPLCQTPPPTIMHGRSVGPAKWRVIRKRDHGNDNYYSEVSVKGKSGWSPSFRQGPTKSALGNMPADEKNFPVTMWARDVLVEGTERLQLDSRVLRMAARPGLGRLYRPDGSNLPWIVQDLRDRHPDRHRAWVEHLQTALGDLEDVTTGEFPDTKQRYVKLHYAGDFCVPAWMASDGTLRMLALTLPAYLPGFEGIYLIEEPENGIHPMAMETVFQSLKSVYGAQILIATHSPVVLGCAEPRDVICFKKDDSGATDLVAGDEHPALRSWRGGTDLQTLYASGILG